MNKKELLRSLKFLLISASAGIIQVATFTVLDEVLHLDYWLCYLVALVLSVLWNFTINRKYTFQSDANLARAMILVALYYCAFTPATTWLEHALTGKGWNEYAVLALNMILNFVTEFLFQRFVVYGKNVDSKPVNSKK